jgi:hypothetical protein
MKTMLLTVTLVVLAAAPSHAVTFFTPMARAEGAGTLACRAVNVGKKPIAITVTRGDLNGSDAQISCTSVAPGSGCATAPTGTTLSYCRFDFEGSKRAVRGSLTVDDADGTRILIEAR